jgi:hypothetical protein
MSGRAFGCYAAIGAARTGEAPLLFAVGLKLQAKSDHITVEAEDALIAALKVKMQFPDASITYVRRQNKRGDTRHPMHGLGRGGEGR